MLNMCGGLDWSFSEPEREDQVALIPTDDRHTRLEFQGLKHFYMVNVMGSSLKKNHSTIRLPETHDLVRCQSSQVRQMLVTYMCNICFFVCLF